MAGGATTSERQLIDGDKLPLDERLERVEHLAAHRLTLIGMRGKSVGLCRCSWTSEVSDDSDAIVAEWRAHVEADSQLPLWGLSSGE